MNIGHFLSNSEKKYAFSVHKIHWSFCTKTKGIVPEPRIAFLDKSDKKTKNLSVSNEQQLQKQVVDGSINSSRDAPDNYFFTTSNFRQVAVQ